MVAMHAYIVRLNWIYSNPEFSVYNVLKNNFVYFLAWSEEAEGEPSRRREPYLDYLYNY
jgi:hypothetical protein